MTASLGWKSCLRQSGVVNYTKPFNGIGNEVLESEFLYRTGGFLITNTRFAGLFGRADNRIRGPWVPGMNIDTLGNAFKSKFLL